ncbi:hypothetical protein DLAC_07751 [Tieghemostelium lacteum]|uniref:Transmembrane protein n=1 Tax=Tieghemostelium lacteum TaxID=361077 RepID=A0A151ZAA1_TIELA|nr:hypothetical protein DLAC_07751 [Tieghemostelium lacteum]|eukprot:KYQ90880.1 hypothetical protein DLAC_07751 [Tieghemostelium lacteum]
MKQFLTVKLIFIIFLIISISSENRFGVEALLCNNEGSQLCPVCLLGICLIQNPIVITALSTITDAINLTADLTLSNILTINGDLTCNSNINLLGGVLVVNGAIELKSNCKFFIKNQSGIKSNATKTIFKDLSLTFQTPTIVGVNSELTFDGNFDVIMKELVGVTGTADPRLNFLSTAVNVTKTVGATLSATVNTLTANFNNNFQGLNIQNIDVLTLKLSNSLTQITIPNANTQYLYLTKVLAKGVSELKNLVSLVESTLTIDSVFSLPGTFSSVNSVIQITTPGAMTIGNVLSNSTNWVIQNTLTLNTYDFLNCVVNVTSQILTLSGNGVFENTPLQFISQTLNQSLNVLSETTLINNLLPGNLVTGLDKIVLGTAGSSGAIGKLLLGDVTSPVSLIYNLGATQIESLGGLIQSTGSLQLGSQINPINDLALHLKKLVVSHGQLELTGSLLNIVDKISFITKGTLSLTQNTILNLGGIFQVAQPFTDLLLDNVNAILQNVVFNIDNLELPNRLKVLSNSNITIGGLTLATNQNLDNLENVNFVVVLSDEDTVQCNGQTQTPSPVGSSEYQFICDEKLVALRLINCTQYTCNDGRCVASVDNCPLANGTCPLLTPIKCWNGDCALLTSLCKPMPACGTNEMRCLDGCIPALDNTTTCPNCTNPLTCVDPLTPYYGCPFGKVQCQNGQCQSDVTKCCTVGTQGCISLPSLFRPSLAYTPVDSVKDITVPIIYKTNSTFLDIYGYINLPNGFLSVLFNNRLTINRLSDSYLDQVLGTEIWGNSTTASFRDVSVSFTFDLQLTGLLSPVFSQPVHFELKIPNLNQYNLSQICLFFINTSTNSWQCMNQQSLVVTPKGTLLGSTNHFTSFAVLIKSWSDDSDDEGGTDGGNDGGGNDGGTDGGGNDGEGGTNNSKSNNSSSLSRKTLIILVASIVGGVVVISVVAGFFIHYNIKHGGVKYWWKSKKRGLSLSPSTSLTAIQQQN